MTSDEQIEVAEARGQQDDKKLIESTRALRSHIKEVVKKRRSDKVRLASDSGGRSPRRPGEGFIQASGGGAEVRRCPHDDGSAPINEIDLRDKGKAYQDVLAMAQQLMEFAEGRFQALKAKTPSRDAAAV